MDSGFVAELVKYLVEKGYDSDDLAEMGKSRAVNFIAAISTLCPDLENEIFLVHLKVFLQSELRKYKSLKMYRHQQK